MNTSIVRFVKLSSAIAAFAMLSTSTTAFAQGNAGTDSAIPGCQPDGTRQSYSYEPRSFAAGDKVVVSVDEARLMKGTTTQGMVKKGQAFDVLKVQGPWLGAEIDIDGKKVTGWIWSRQVIAANQQEERRSFSYEPSYSQPPVYRRYRGDSSPKKELWQLPKTDPRRYGSGL